MNKTKWTHRFAKGLHLFVIAALLAGLALGVAPVAQAATFNIADGNVAGLIAYEAREKIPEAVEEFERAAELADQAGNSALVAQARMRAGMLLQRAPVLLPPTESGD